MFPTKDICTCFDDLCINCQDDILSSSEDETLNQSNSSCTSISSTETDNGNSTNESLADNEESSFELDSSNELLLIDEEAEKQHKLDQITKRIDELTKQFSLIFNCVNDQSLLIIQLKRQHNNCKKFLTKLEDFMVTFETNQLLSTSTKINCANWLNEIELLKEKFQQFDNKPISIILNLNNKLEFLFQDFSNQKHQSLSDLSLNELKITIHEINSILNSLIKIDLEVDDLMDYIEVERRDQLKLTDQFVKSTKSIFNSIQLEIKNNHILELDPYSNSSLKKLILKINEIKSI